MLEGYRRTLSAVVGFDTKPLMLLRVENPGGVPINTLLTAVGSVPGVERAAAATATPYGPPGPQQLVSNDDDSKQAALAERAAVTTGFFDTLGVPVRAGRDFTAFDSPNARRAIINDALGRLIFPGRDPIGRSVVMEGMTYAIVGVVGNYADTGFQHPARHAMVYLPLPTADRGSKRLPVLVRAGRRTAALLDPVRRTLRDAAAGNTVASAYTFEQIISVGGQEILVGTAPLFPLVVTGMALTAAGIYGVLAFATARRRKEFAVRLAVGAHPSDIGWLVAMDGLRLTMVGSCLATAVTFALSRIVRAGGGAGGAFDPTWRAFAIPLAIVVAISVLAAAVPSRRAARTDPALLLRAD
jgi:hypothetical protein